VQSRPLITAVIIILLVGGSLYFIYRYNKQKSVPQNLNANNTNKTEEENQNQNSSPTTTVPVENLSNIDPQKITETSTVNFKFALKKAKEWRKDASLVAVSVKIPENLDPTKVEETYVFAAKKSPSYYWAISISNRTHNFIRFITPKEDYLSPTLPKINFKYWKINYAQAFQTAESKQGKVLREEKKSQISISATLSHSQPNNWLWWTVEYKNKETDEIATIKVNADSGKVLQSITSENSAEGI